MPAGLGFEALLAEVEDEEDEDDFGKEEEEDADDMLFLKGDRGVRSGARSNLDDESEVEGSRRKLVETLGSLSLCLVIAPPIWAMRMQLGCR